MTASRTSRNIATARVPGQARTPATRRPAAGKRSASTDALDAAASNALLLALQPVEPAPRVRARILDRLLSRTTPAATLRTITVAADATPWQPFAPGIERKVLFQQAGTFAFLLRLKAGAVIPAHEHASHEECLVLAGEVEIDGRVVRRDDFHFAPQGVRHTPIRARSAALLYLRSAHPDGAATNAHT